MKLEPEIVRDILLYIEEAIVMTDNGRTLDVTTNDIVIHYNGIYSKGEVLYALQRLKEADFIIASFRYASDRITNSSVTAITYDGHEFIKTIRDKDVWDKIKDALPSVGSNAVWVIKEVAKNIISASISAALSLPNR